MLDYLEQEIKVGSTCIFITGGKNYKIETFIIVNVNEEKHTFSVKRYINDNLILTKKTTQNCIIIDDIVEAKPELFI